MGKCKNRMSAPHHTKTYKMDISILRTDASNPDFITLVQLLDAELAIRDGETHDFYHQFNKIDALKHVIVLYEGARPLSCGALKEYAPGVMEVKRMFTQAAFRGKGLAARVLAALEDWADTMGYHTCILETGINQPEAIALYKKCGYGLIPNYGQYAGVDNSFCFEKNLKTAAKLV